MIDIHIDHPFGAYVKICSRQILMIDIHIDHPFGAYVKICSRQIFYVLKKAGCFFQQRVRVREYPAG
jgi:hypothetical protein